MWSAEVRRSCDQATMRPCDFDRKQAVPSPPWQHARLRQAKRFRGDWRVISSRSRHLAGEDCVARSLVRRVWRSSIARVDCRSLRTLKTHPRPRWCASCCTSHERVGCKDVLSRVGSASTSPPARIPDWAYAGPSPDRHVPTPGIPARQAVRLTDVG